MYCRPRPTQVLPAVVHPTKCCVQHTYKNVVQPNIYPTHTTNVQHTNIVKQNYFPQTQSFVDQVSTQEVNMGPGPFPGYGPGPGVAGASMPGYGPGPGVAGASMPGYGPGSGVAGAATPGYKPGTGVAGAATPGPKGSYRYR
ncbi:CotD family spore coat protein [Bacillus sp. 03113]|uniref:CotD family spore coat protein n=1 Tax=Bacillus sp. 03113 TaxID=2578211 RepID=UPI0011425E8A|nr:CotD family spore coat protein [Bacillus sp. 03113]